MMTKQNIAPFIRTRKRGIIIEKYINDLFESIYNTVISKAQGGLFILSWIMILIFQSTIP